MLWVFLAGGFVLAQGDINFGDAPVGETETATYTFRVSEANEGIVTVTGVAFPGGAFACGPFELLSLPPLPATLQPGEFIRFEVAFSPTAAEVYTASFTVTTLARARSSLVTQEHTVTVSGRGDPSGLWPPLPPFPPPVPKPQTVSQIAPEVAELVANNTEFAFDLYQAIRAREGNLLYSPCSVSLALAMAYAGARDTTKEQMAEVLHFTLAQEGFHPALQTLSLTVASRSADPKIQLTIANSLWVQTGYSFLSDFLDLLSENYAAIPRPVDFVDAPVETRRAINDWVSHETEGKIKHILDPGAITPDTQLVLANAVYFKADWLHPFSTAATRDGPFYLLDGSEAIVPLMEQEEDFRYTSGEGYQAIELPYSGEDLSMVILVPKQAAERSDPWLPSPPPPLPSGPIDPLHFGEFERSLVAERFASIVAGLQSMTVHLVMPTFTYASGLALKDTLARMGMTDAFTPHVADFSGMDGTRLLYISDVVHKAFVAVDEKGTEAAAATAVPVATIDLPPEPVHLTIDCPFIFVIRDVKTGAILFVGRVLDPRAR